MTHGFTRWMVAPTLLLALTACTPLTNADGFTPTPVATPNSTALTEWDKEQLGGSVTLDIPEDAPAAFSRETLPEHQSLIPENAGNGVSKSANAATQTKHTLRLPKPVPKGVVTIAFACVDGTLNIGNEDLGTLGDDCSGELNRYTFDIEHRTKSLALQLTVQPGTSYSVAAFEDHNSGLVFD